MGLTLYSLALSHPAQAARLALEQKGLDHRVVDLPSGSQPLALRALGFRDGTVPALRLDDRRVQGSMAIMRELDELQDEPRLHPRDPEARRAVEAAEAWGEAELQPVPRRIFRWGAEHSRDVRRWILTDVDRLPAPSALAALGGVAARRLARMAGATGARVRADLAALPGQLDRVDELLAAGLLGGPAANAADLQIGTAVRVLLAFEDLSPLVDGRPAARHARSVLPDYPEPIPAFLPRHWLLA